MESKLLVKAVIKKPNGIIVTKIVDKSDFNRETFAELNSLGKMYLELTCYCGETNFTMNIEKEYGKKIINFGYSQPNNYSRFDEFTVYYENRLCTTFTIKKEETYF